MRRPLSVFGFAILLVVACHGNGPPSSGMPDPMYPGMYYRAAPAPQARGNRSATSDAIAACTSATGIAPTPSACAKARYGDR